ncbi:MAG TPA: hypothetical protein H9745_02345, partial [Candidatus Agathobaculum stercoravium]|nr:hypothetical protein [Candidatus Agathobaculum stercoravium]
TLRPGAGMRAREARLLGQQPAFAYPLGQPGGNTKALLTFARAARPEGDGVIRKRGRTIRFFPSCVPAAHSRKYPVM